MKTGKKFLRIYQKIYHIIMDKNVIGLLLIFKAIKVSLSYAALLIAKNMHSQIYAEKVYVKQESPPKLINMLFVFIGIEVVFTVVTISLIGALMVNIPTFQSTVDIWEVITAFAQDYVLYLVSILTHGSILATAMYSKKYFLYKDDGLRAIRAFTDIMLQYSIVNGLIPFNFMIQGTLDMIRKT